MSKLKRYESLEELKADAKTNMVSADVLKERQEKLESLVYFLRGDKEKENPNQKTEASRQDMSTS